MGVFFYSINTFFFDRKIKENLMIKIDFVKERIDSNGKIRVVINLFENKLFREGEV